VIVAVLTMFLMGGLKLNFRETGDVATGDDVAKESIAEAAVVESQVGSSGSDVDKRHPIAGMQGNEFSGATSQSEPVEPDVANRSKKREQSSMASGLPKPNSNHLQTVQQVESQSPETLAELQNTADTFNTRSQTADRDFDNDLAVTQAKVSPGVISAFQAVSARYAKKDRLAIRVLVLRLDPKTPGRFVVNGSFDRLSLEAWFQEITRVIEPYDLVAMQGLPFDWVSLFSQTLSKPSGSPLAPELKIEMLAYDPSMQQHGAESVVFLWDRSRMQCERDRSYLVDDPGKRFFQPPMVAAFQARVGGVEGRLPLRFSLIHAIAKHGRQIKEPNRLALENPLEDLFVQVRRFEFENYGEEDCLLMGEWSKLQGEKQGSVGAALVGWGEAAKTELAENLVRLQSDSDFASRVIMAEQKMIPEQVGIPQQVGLAEQGDASGLTFSPNLADASALVGDHFGGDSVTGRHAMHLVFDQRYTNEFISRSTSTRDVGASAALDSDSVAATRGASSVDRGDLLNRGSAGEDPSDFYGLGFDAVVSAEFNAFESPRFESVATAPGEGVNR